MWKKVIAAFLMISMIGSLVACGATSNDRTGNGKKEASQSPLAIKEKRDNEVNVGNCLFNAEESDSIEISGEDLLDRKEVSVSIEIMSEKNIDLTIKRDSTGQGISMTVLYKKQGADLVSCLGESLDEWSGAKEDFYYQMAAYDFNMDGKKEVIVAAGNKTDILEVNVYQIDFSRDFDNNNPKLLTQIEGGSKSYVDKKNKICVIDSENKKIIERSIESDADSVEGEESNSQDSLEYTDEYFVEKYSIYRNPIDKYFWPKMYSWDASQVEIREAQNSFKKAWKKEYRNMMKWLKKKCVYDEDKKNLVLLEKNVEEQVKIAKKVMETELINAYETDPDSNNAKDSVSRISLLGNGTRDRLNQSEGEIYRDTCMRILNLHGGEGEYEFIFREEDY